MPAKEGALGALVRKVKARADAGEAVSIGLVQEVAGPRAAGPMLLLPALLVVSPLSIVPGLPSVVGLTTVLVAGQVVLGREPIRLPRWLTRRRLASRHADMLLGFLQPVSRMADGVARRRARALTAAPMRRIGAAVCVLMGAIMPLLEFVPFTSTWAATIIAVYALAITAGDGLLALAFVGLVLGAVALAVTLLA